VRERLIEACGAPLAVIREGEGPVVGFALHAGHGVRPGLEDYFAVDDDARLREEDPFTARMVPEGLALVEVLRSRFEVDLNRPRLRAVYQGPEDSWGLRVYRRALPNSEDRVSRAVHDAFYATAFDVLSNVVDRHGGFVVLDMHSYNHRRDGVDAPVADELENPEINIGTRWFDRARWADVVEGFSAAMVEGGYDCRENVKFGGGHFASWVAETFPETGMVLSIEFKKTYMDEWTGVVDDAGIGRIRRALSTAVPRVADALGRTMRERETSS
jgi:N-formylglutamate amidohydrolase